MSSARAQKLRQLFAQHGVRGASARRLPKAQWNRDALSGRLTELSGRGAKATLTVAMGLVSTTQRQGEPVAWVAHPDCMFYPPDAHDSGVELDALVVVRVLDRRKTARTADRLLRSGAFGLIVVDLGQNAQLPLPMQGRLVGLAQKHDTALLCLTEKNHDAPSLGSMVSLRAEVTRTQVSVDRFSCHIVVLKDKQRGPTWEHTEVVRGPTGLC